MPVLVEKSRRQGCKLSLLMQFKCKMIMEVLVCMTAAHGLTTRVARNTICRYLTSCCLPPKMPLTIDHTKINIVSQGAVRKSVAVSNNAILYNNTHNKQLLRPDTERSKSQFWFLSLVDLNKTVSGVSGERSRHVSVCRGERHRLMQCVAVRLILLFTTVKVRQASSSLFCI